MSFASELGVVLIWVSMLIVVALGIFIFRTWMQGGKFTKDVNIESKVVVITGANTGIGKETAIDLARRGGKVYIACRDVSRGDEALSDIKRESGSDQVHLLQLDLASLESVREFSKKFHELETKLHILINNAGIMACPQGKTKDGFELQLGTNHLGHFLLTNLLLDLIKAAAPSRIVVVSSILHRIGKIKKNDLNSEKSYYKWLVYGQSKLSNILFANELAKRLDGTGVTANSLHPGVINSNLSRNLDWLTKLFFNPAKWLVFKTVRQGAQTQIRLAVDPELECVSGKYFADCRECVPSKAARDADTAEWLWRRSEEMTQLSVVLSQDSLIVR